MLIFTLTFTAPIGTLIVYAAPLEDCDLDGFDDATGVPVPWPGYDETKGDTPSGPGGSNTTQATTSSSSNSGSSSSSSSSSSSNNTAPTSSSNKTSVSESSSGTKSKLVIANDNSVVEVANITPVSDEVLAQIVNTKGTIEIANDEGNSVHAGSVITVSGTGFSGDIEGLEIEIHSTPIILGTVVTNADGSFQLQIQIPEDLESGTHHIIVSYQGNEITRQTIEVGPKAVSNFGDALTVGFSSENRGLIPGIIILIGLAAVGGIALFFGAIKKSDN